jgi:hypothetical protein
MDSVSRPLLIALGGVLVLLAIWLVALRPKPVALNDTPLAATQEIPKAKAAVTASAEANAKLQAATGEPAAQTAPAANGAAPANGTAAAPADKPATRAAGRLDGSIVREMRQGKIVVVLFWNAKGADDIATRGVLRDLDRHAGKVTVHVVPVSRVARYPAITQGVTIAQSPTTLVIGHKRNTRVITGLSEPRELTQAVGDALAGR